MRRERIDKGKEEKDLVKEKKKKNDKKKRRKY